MQYHVPWNLQTMAVHQLYGCGRCAAEERYRAMNNVPHFGHLCRACYEELPEDIKKHYMKVERLS